MDPEDLALRVEEIKLRREELTHQGKSARTSGRLAVLTVLFSAAAVISGIVFTSGQARSNDAQFKKNVRDTTYNNIVTGMGSPSAAVQTNSMRLLAQYVKDPENFDNPGRQQEGVVNAIQTLAAFIEDKSVDTSSGLTDYESPQPIVLSRAMNQLKLLDSDASLGPHAADISRANLHGISLPFLAPQGPFFAVATDFRRATLNNLNLTKMPTSLRGAFFTCAVLKKAQFGQADVGSADFSGADLTDADLSRVRNLSSVQLRGVTVSTKTRLPEGIEVRGPFWGTGSQKCTNIADEMTGMFSGQGYRAAIPCPLNTQSWGDSLARRRFKGDLGNLVKVCITRSGG